MSDSMSHSIKDYFKVFINVCISDFDNPLNIEDRDIELSFTGVPSIVFT